MQGKSCCSGISIRFELRVGGGTGLTCFFLRVGVAAPAGLVCFGGVVLGWSLSDERSVFTAAFSGVQGGLWGKCSRARGSADDGEVASARRGLAAAGPRPFQLASLASMLTRMASTIAAALLELSAATSRPGRRRISGLVAPTDDRTYISDMSSGPVGSGSSA